MRKSTYLTVMCIYFYIFNEKSKNYNGSKRQMASIESLSWRGLGYKTGLCLLATMFRMDEGQSMGAAHCRSRYKKLDAMLLLRLRNKNYYVRTVWFIMTHFFFVGWYYNCYAPSRN